MKPERLLAETGFVTRLAHRLTFGPEDPEDVVQQTWLAALSHPPGDEGRLRPWLATVLRNVIRQSRRSRLRRAARELAAARPEAASPAEEVRRREEARARIVAAVLSLPEPNRTAVLLRYFDELPPRKIATRLSVPVATVKSRIARGLRRLRADLDEEYGGDRRSWALALLPLAGLRRGGAGAAAAPAAAKLAAGAAVVAFLTAALLSLLPGDGPSGAPERTADAGPAGSFDDAPGPPPDLEIGDGGGSYGGDPDRPFGRPRGGRVVDGAGRAVPGALVLFAVDPRAPDGSVETEPDGTFRSYVGGREGTEWVCACREGVGASPWIRSREGAGDVVLELAAGGIVEGTVAHPETGEPAPLARVRADFGWRDDDECGFYGRADEAGRYRLEGVPLGTWLLPKVKTDDRAVSYFDPGFRWLPEDEIEATLEEGIEEGWAKILTADDRVFRRDLPGRRIRGIPATLALVPPDGERLPETVRLHRAWRWSLGWGERGEEVRPDGAGELPVHLPEGRVSLRVEAGDLYGTVPLRVIGGDGPPERIRVELRPRPTILARLVDEDGDPVRLGGVEVSVQRGFGGGSRGGKETTDARGRVDLTDRVCPTAAGYADETRLILSAAVPGYLEPNSSFPNREIPMSEVEAMAADVDGGPIVIDIPLRRSRRVRFTVVDPDGEPVPGVRLYPEHPERFAEDEWTSDGRGEVEVGLLALPEPHEGGFGLRARHPYKEKHFDVGSLLVVERQGRLAPEDFRMQVWRYRKVRVTVLDEDGAAFANETVSCQGRELRTDGDGAFTIELLDYRTSVSVKAEGYLSAGSKTEDGRATVRLRPARRITVRVVAPPEVPDEEITVRVGPAGTRSQWAWGRPGADGRPRTLDLEFPPDRPAEVRAGTADHMHDGIAPVPEGADFVEVALRERSLTPTHLRFVHPDGTPATETVIRFALYRDTEFSREGLTPDENGILTLDLPPGPNRWSWEPKMVGHRLIGSAPRFTVPAAEPVDIVMERADRIVLALDGQGGGVKIEERDVDVTVTGPEGELDFDRSTTIRFDGEMLLLSLAFRQGPAKIRIEHAGETYVHEHEEPGLEPVRIRLR